MGIYPTNAPPARPRSQPGAHWLGSGDALPGEEDSLWLGHCLQASLRTCSLRMPNTHTHTHTHTHNHASFAAPGAEHLLPTYICRTEVLIFMGKGLCLFPQHLALYTQRKRPRSECNPHKASQETGHMMVKTMSLGVQLTRFQSHPIFSLASP